MQMPHTFYRPYEHLAMQNSWLSTLTILTIILTMPTGFEVLGALSASYNFTKDIVAYFKAVHDAKTDIPNILLRFENDSKLLEHLTTFFSEAILESLDGDSLSHLQRVFSHILPIAQRVCVKLRRYERNKLWDRATWAIVGKDLQASEEDIYDWIMRLQTCLALFPKSAKTAMLSSMGTDSANAPLVETLTAQQRMEDLVAKFREIGSRQLKSLEPSLQLSTELSDTIKLSSPAQIQLVDSKEYIVEFKKLPASMANDPAIKEEMKGEMAKLVSVLSAVQPTDMFLLRTRFFFESSPRLGQPAVPFGILYDLPAKYTHPNRLIDVLRDTDSNGNRILRHSLDQRFELARQISTAILFIHSVGWVHKGVRTSNIFLAQSEGALAQGRRYPEFLGTSFLTGFDYTRRDAARSTGDETEGAWQRAIYQPPDRNISSDEDSSDAPSYKAEHDIYSLGVVLVEIGRWKPLEMYPHLFKNATSLERKMRLEDMAEGLRVPLGGRYVEVALRCLRILNEGSRPMHGGPTIRNIVVDLEDLAAATK